MDTKWTPGPHTAHKCRCGHSACDQYIISTQRSSGFNKADADLYTAAPDLYAALEGLTRVLVGTWDCDENGGGEAWNAARAALAKARGEAQ